MKLSLPAGYYFHPYVLMPSLGGPLNSLGLMSPSATTAKLSYSFFDGEVRFVGRNISFDQDALLLKTGTIDRMSLHSGWTSITFSELKMSAGEFNAMIHAPDPQKSLELFLKDADTLSGGSVSDQLCGYGGVDRISGNKGNDRLDGGSGADWLFGGDGTDFLTGGAGRDHLEGGQGGDRFVVAAAAESGTGPKTRDVIVDFGTGGDKLDLHLMDARGTVGGDQPFRFIHSNEFTKHEGEVRFVATESLTIVSGDINGDGKADFRIELSGHHVLTASDFIL